LCRQGFQLGFGILWRVYERGPVESSHFDDSGLVQTHLLFHERVRIDGLDAVRSQCLFGEILEIEGDNRLGARANCRRQYVAVIRVGEIQALCHRFATFHQAVWYRLAHQPSRPLDPILEFRPFGKQVSNPFRVNRLGLLRAEQPRSRQTQQEIPQWRGIQHAGVEDDDKPHRSVAHVQFLRLTGEGIQRFPARLITLFLVGGQVLEPDTAVCSDTRVRGLR